MNGALSDAERQAIELIIAGSPDEPALRAQLATASVGRRRNSGAGIYLDLRVAEPVAVATAAPEGSVRGERMVNALFGGQSCAVLLWLSGGVMDQLEIAVFDGGSLPGMELSDPQAS